jgi:hypothetical protein
LPPTEGGTTEFILQLTAAACATVLVGWVYAISIERSKHRLTQPDD